MLCMLVVTPGGFPSGVYKSPSYPSDNCTAPGTIVM